MSNLLNCIHFINKYTKITVPIIDKKISEYTNYTKRIRKSSIKAYATEALSCTKFSSAVASVCTLYPNVNSELATEVMFSFQSIVNYLKNICEHSSVSTEPFLRLIFSSLKDAVNIRADSYEKYFTFYPSKDDNGYLSLLVEKCRQKVQLLPSFNIIRDSIVTYLALFIDLQITKYSADDSVKEINLLSWSDAHKQKYPDISNWEFCMSIDSTLCIELLLTLGTDPDLSEQTTDCLNNVFFPWICGVQKILEGYLNYNDDLTFGKINYLFYYSNLKEYEDRISFFIQKATSIDSCNTNYHKSILKILLSIYITQPQASEGMNKITSKALFCAGGKGMSLYRTSINILRWLKYL